MFTVLSVQLIKERAVLLFHSILTEMSYFSLNLVFASQSFHFKTCMSGRKFNILHHSETQKEGSPSGTEYMLIDRPDVATSSFFVS